MPVKLPKLPYAYNALEPHIDAETMRLHHDKHNAAYVDKLNEALVPYPELSNKNPETLLFNLHRLPSDIQEAVQNQAGGAANHAMFWKIMSPKGGGEPTGVIGEHIERDFGSFEEFREQFSEQAKKLFGSGWVWLVWNQDHLEIAPLHNQDNPLLVGHYPIMGIDVWEHAWAYQYKTEKEKYIKAWWNVVNWPEIERRFVNALKFAARG